MSDRTPTDILEQEHRVIEKVVGVLPALISVLESGQAVPADMLRDIVEFMRSFADACHHGKEETHLFPVLVKRGVPDTGCPIGGLMHEHNQGRTLVKDLAASVEAYASGDPAARESLVTSLRGVAGLYPNHIWKEDFLLFPMTNKVLAPEDQQALLDQFALVDAGIGLATHRRFEEIARDVPARVMEMAAAVK